LGSIDASVLEKPLSKSRGDLLGYAAARVLEALLKGYTGPRVPRAGLHEERRGEGGPPGLEGANSSTP